MYACIGHQRVCVVRIWRAEREPETRERQERVETGRGDADGDVRIQGWCE